MKFKINLESETPVFRQIRNSIVMGIAEGLLLPGEQLPSVRDLAQDTGLNPMTINKAYNLLKTEGFIVTDKRKGSFISREIERDEKSEADFIEKLQLLLVEEFILRKSKKEVLNLCNKLLEGF